jgi:hypothetical protein
MQAIFLQVLALDERYLEAARSGRRLQSRKQTQACRATPDTDDIVDFWSVCGGRRKPPM